MTTPLFSLIMPTYGVEAYLDRAIQSVRNQSVADWELIVVDDCSPDSCAAIAERHAAEDSRIKVVHHELNQGLSGARNTGLAVATGDYVMFPDPDDYVDTNLLELAVQSLQRNLADAVVFGLVEEYRAVDGTLKDSRTIIPEAEVCTTPDAVHKKMLSLEQQTLYGYCHNKLIRRNAIGDIQFEDVPLAEDILFNVAVFYRVNTLNVVAAAPVHYQRWESAGNLTNKFVENYFVAHRKRIQALYDQQKVWGLDTPEVRSILGGLFGRYCISELEHYFDERSGRTREQCINWCHQLFSDLLFLELIPGAKSADSKALAAGLAILKTRNAALCADFGQLVHVAKHQAAGLFTKLRNQR